MRDAQGNVIFALISEYCKTLEHLYIVSDYVYENDFDELSNAVVENLKSLHYDDFECESIDDQLSVLLKRTVNLEELQLGSEYTEGYCLLNLTDKCTTLSIPFCQEISNEMFIEVLKKVPNIKKLDISGNERLKPKSLYGISAQLVSLSVDRNAHFITDESFKTLNLPNLKKLNLGKNDYVRDEFLCNLNEKCPALEELSLRECEKISNNGFRHLAKFQKLTYLNLSGTEIQNSSLKFLGEELTNLMKIVLSNCYCLTEKGVMEFLAVSQQLERLDMGDPKDLKPTFFMSALKVVEERKNNLSLIIQVSFGMGTYDESFETSSEVERLKLKKQSDRPPNLNRCKIRNKERYTDRKEIHQGIVSCVVKDEIWYIDYNRIINGKK